MTSYTASIGKYGIMFLINMPEVNFNAAVKGGFFYIKPKYII